MFDDIESGNYKSRVDISLSEREQAIIESIREEMKRLNYEFDYMTAVLTVKKIAEINPYRSGTIV